MLTQRPGMDIEHRQKGNDPHTWGPGVWKWLHKLPENAPSLSKIRGCLDNLCLPCPSWCFLSFFLFLLYHQHFFFFCINIFFLLYHQQFFSLVSSTSYTLHYKNNTDCQEHYDTYKSTHTPQGIETRTQAFQWISGLHVSCFVHPTPLLEFLISQKKIRTTSTKG